MRCPRWVAAICLAALVAAALPASAGVHLERIARPEGLPSSQVHAVLQGSQGFLWFAGPNGLARYDGGRLRVYGTRDGLSTQGLRALAVDHQGRLWIGSDLGVDVRELDGTIAPLMPVADWRWGFVEALATGPGGRMWIATSRGLLSSHPDAGLEEVTEPALADNLITAVIDAGEGGLWAAGPRAGLWRRFTDGWRPPPEAGWEEVAPLRSLARGPRGTLLVGGERGVVEIDLRGRRRSGPADPRAQDMVTALLAVDDEVWLGSGSRLRRHRFQEGAWGPGETVFEGALVNQIMVDRQRNVWIATDNAGAAKASVLRRAIQTVNGPCASPVFALATTPAGDWLVGGDHCSWRLSGLGDAAGPQVAPLAELASLKVWDLTVRPDGGWWIAAEQGLYRRDAGGRIEQVDGGSPLLASPGRALLWRDDTLWLGTVVGLVVLRGGAAREVTAENASLGYVYTLEVDPEGRLWAGTIGNGLWRESLPGGDLERVEAGGLSRRGNVYAIDFDARGRAAVAQDDRLLVLDGDDGFTLQPATEDEVAGWSLLFSADGSALWVGGVSGLVRYDLGERRAVRRLTATMGLAGDEFTSSRSLARDRSGRLMCGLEGGLSMVEPAALRALAEPPEIERAEVTWSGAELTETAAGLEVAWGRWSVEARVFSPWFIDQRGLLQRHRLVGFDRVWNPAAPTATHRARYTALPPGAYTLEAQAYSPLTGWGPVAEVLGFQVLPPWWQRWWAIAGGLILLVALAAAAGRARTRHLRHRTRELEAAVAERTAELERVAAEAERWALVDDLTGLPNQRSFWLDAQRFAAAARRHERPFALVVLDLDNFKAVNDRWGHRVGDELLAYVSRELAAVTRDEDILARYGGEELVLLVSSGNEPDAEAAAQRMRESLAARPFRTSTGARVPITSSFGVSAWQGDDDSPEALFRRADAALYEAKRVKDRIVTWAPGLGLGEPVPGTG